MAFNPDAYLAKSTGGFDPDAYLANGQKELKSSAVETGIMQGLQGSTGGFLDEISGGFEAGGRAIGVKGLGGPLKDISLSEDSLPISRDELLAAYKEGRDKKREILKTQESERPALSIASNIAGGFASPVNKLTKGFSAAKTGLAMGGFYGLGNSEADSLSGMAIDTAKGAAIGGTIGKGFGVLADKVAPTSEKIAGKISTAIPKKNVDDLITSADNLGIKLTPGMLDDSGFVERLESSLAKSPSFMGQRLAGKLKTINEQLREKSASMIDEATNLSPFQVGEKFKSGVNAQVGEKLAPISQVFDEVAQSTKFIPISDRSRTAVIRNIQGLDTYKLTAGAGKPSQYVEMIGRIENADQVKTAMTMLNADIRAAQGAEKQVLIGIKNKLGNLEENSITRAAIAKAREAGMRESTGKKIGSEIVKDLQEARKNYRGLSEDLQGLAENARVKTQKGPSAFIDAVDEIPSERIQDKFFNPENLRSLNNLKEKFPEQFNLLKSGKLREIGDSAIDNSVNGQGNLSTQKFLNEVRKLNPEVKSMLFNNPQAINDIENIQRSLPRNFNPSGTASEQSIQEAVYRNVKDIPQYLLYKGASTNLGRKIGDKVSLVTEDALRDVTSSAAKNLSAPSARVASEALAMKVPTEGPEKWASDGANKLNAHGELTPDEIESLKKTKQGKEILIKASDLDSKSKAMDNLVKKIRTSSNERGQ
ncbi:hypothetical protein UFOVP610_11 [uncultured Caudovirales phage]|uniref:Uncharacterized protein n=1 Tax=uncultured Caudovirales phage TaxID=2100421 RepID=A0A6J5N276_9CAUD|nr:hypothetical protein UFOVP610_11 [uncultured Caudovirales phage]